MKVYQTNEIKNIALIGSAGSGKTTLAESILFEAGIIRRRGTVEAKNTVSDYFPVEQEYGYSVFPTVFHAEWNNKKLNFIDCPGSDDFVGGADLLPLVHPRENPGMGGGGCGLLDGRLSGLLGGLLSSHDFHLLCLSGAP